VQKEGRKCHGEVKKIGEMKCETGMGEEIKIPALSHKPTGHPQEGDLCQRTGQPPRVLSLLTAVLNAVISSLSFKSRRLPGVSLVHSTRSRCIRVGLASAAFEGDESPVAFLSELHAAVFHGLEPRG
jgi:hypothetical protein